MWCVVLFGVREGDRRWGEPSCLRRPLSQDKKVARAVFAVQVAARCGGVVREFRVVLGVFWSWFVVSLGG